MHRIHYVWFPNNPRQVDIRVCIAYSLNSNTQMTSIRIYGEPFAHKFCAVDIFFNITRRQVTSPVAMFHHVSARGLMIPRVILIFIKCLSANQNQLFNKKV